MILLWSEFDWFSYEIIFSLVFFDFDADKFQQKLTFEIGLQQKLLLRLYQISELLEGPFNKSSFLKLFKNQNLLKYAFDKFANR